MKKTSYAEMYSILNTGLITLEICTYFNTLLPREEQKSLPNNTKNRMKLNFSAAAHLLVGLRGFEELMFIC